MLSECERDGGFDCGKPFVFLSYIKFHGPVTVLHKLKGLVLAQMANAKVISATPLHFALELGKGVHALLLCGMVLLGPSIHPLTCPPPLPLLLSFVLFSLKNNASGQHTDTTKDEVF